MGDADNGVGTEVLTEDLSPREHGGRALLERERELRALDALLVEAREARGRVTLIEGDGGIGKTRLLREAGARATAAGLIVLTARGGELERDFGFGIVRQLLEPALARAAPDERRALTVGAARLCEPLFAAAPELAGEAADPTHATLHGLYWLVANLAERSPLLLAVDDVHWADGASLRFLIHLARRLEGLPVAVALATRTDEEGDQPELLRRLVLEARPPILRPRALSEQGVWKMVGAALGDQAGPMLRSACHAATVGNPFLVHELLHQLRLEGRPAGEISPAHVSRLAPERIAASVLIRVGRIDPAAASLSRAVAVLGAEATLANVSALAELEPAAAHALAAALADAAILERREPLGFVHPIVRTAVYDEIPEAIRAAMHRSAARVLAEQGSEPSSIAVQLLATHPHGDELVVSTLLSAGRAALSDGAPESAAAYLRRALAEPPLRHARPQVLHLLGLAEAGSGDPRGTGRLREAVEASPPGRARAEITRSLAGMIGQQGLLEEASERCLAVAAELPESEREFRLQLEVMGCSAGRLVFGETYGRASERLQELAREERGAAETPAQRALLASLSFQRGLDGGSAAEAAALAERAFSGGLLREQGVTSPTVWDAVYALIVAEKFGSAERQIKLALQTARATAALPGVPLASTFLSLLAYRRGELARAESEARASLAAAADSGYEQGTSAMAAGCLIEALIDRGERAAARDVLDRVGIGEEMAANVMVQHLLHARGRLRLVTGEVEAGLADLRLHSALAGAPPLRRNPITSNRFDASLCIALARNGEGEEARALAEEQLRVARAWGTPWAIGVALRTCGLVEGGDEGLERLAESGATLETSEGRLEHARALVDLGSALRRSGLVKYARERLAQGMDLAHACGATALLDRAQEELQLAGARPRRVALRGRDSLTPSELRIAEMAAEGMTNKEIAQAQFVTLRTVEMHLSNAYGKLEIGSRRELARALES